MNTVRAIVKRIDRWYERLPMWLHHDIDLFSSLFWLTWQIIGLTSVVWLFALSRWPTMMEDVKAADGKPFGPELVMLGQLFGVGLGMAIFYHMLAAIVFVPRPRRLTPQQETAWREFFVLAAEHPQAVMDVYHDAADADMSPRGIVSQANRIRRMYGQMEAPLPEPSRHPWPSYVGITVVCLYGLVMIVSTLMRTLR